MRLLGQFSASELGKTISGTSNGKRAVVASPTSAREGSFYNMGGVSQHEPPQSCVSIVFGGTNQGDRSIVIRCKRASAQAGFCSISRHVSVQYISAKSLQYIQC